MFGPSCPEGTSEPSSGWYKVLMAASVLIAYVCARLVRHVWKIAWALSSNSANRTAHAIRIQFTTLSPPDGASPV